MTDANSSNTQKRSIKTGIGAPGVRPISPRREDALWREEHTRIRRRARAVADMRRLREGTR